ncbi:MAG: hypothetical protein RLZZ601_2141 [Pseudomonadota bacterium]
MLKLLMIFLRMEELTLTIKKSIISCHQLNLDNDWISFQARFGGVPRKIMVPVSHALAIYARENGQGMSFPFDASQTSAPKEVSPEVAEKPKAGRPSLTIVK